MGTLINLHKKTLENKQAALKDLQKQIDEEYELEPRIPLEQKEAVLKREIEDLKQLIKGENRTVLDIVISGMLDGQYYENMKKVVGYTVDYIINDCFIMEYAKETTADDVERIQAVKKELWSKILEDSPFLEKSGIDKHVFYIPVQKGYEGEGIRKFISTYENEIGNEITILFKKEQTK
ncbi:hypothetical protein HUN88_15200 [Bacillus amyloliquefaciens]|uniref:hypothetical protein n=1 Tax=Bacillus amyloliquefaciens TaxID=1390 RepID=UPI00157FDDA1|nr:hypothetical protein [Bacillus amyloliquefaciens]NUI61100.1 hypothetical protein [Bacillus amyloliquefaciens]